MGWVRGHGGGQHNPGQEQLLQAPGANLGGCCDLLTGRWDAGAVQGEHPGSGAGRGFLLTVLDLLTDFVPVLPAGCAATLLENHFSRLKHQSTRRAPEIPPCFPPAGWHGATAWPNVTQASLAVHGKAE